MLEQRRHDPRLHRDGTKLVLKFLFVRISLSDLIKRELGITTELMSFEELDARVRANRAGSKATTAEIVQIIRDSRGELP
jgi:hypothetical protein